MKLLAFLKKDLLVALSYRLAFLLGLVSMVVSLFMLYYIGRTFSGALSPHLARYGGEYFPYVLVGMAVSSFVTVGLGALARQVRSAQVEGTLEALLSTPTSIYTVLVGSCLWSFVSALGDAVLILGGGTLLLGLEYPLASGAIALLVLGLTFTAFLTVGMLSAAFVMIFKRGDPIQFVFGTSSFFLGGVLFPVEVLPGSFQYASRFLPITHAVRAVRELLLARAGIAQVMPLVANLLVFIAVLGPASILFFRYAVRRAKRDGSLVQY